jgi:glycosyltransferase involved in cell wall biosynthesis
LAPVGGGMSPNRKKILLKAPLLTRSGYGEQSRFALRSLQSREDLFDIYIQPLNWGKTSWINEMNEARQWIDDAIEKTISFIQEGGKFDISLQVTIPNEWEQLAAFNIGYTAGIETTRVAPRWVQQAQYMDKIILVSNHAKNIYEYTGYQAVNQNTNEEVVLKVPPDKLEAVNYPVKTYENLPQIELELEHDINFLCIMQSGPRKNVANTIKWFVEEFKDEEVGLVLKTNIAKNCLTDRVYSFNNIKRVLAELPQERKCKVYLLHGDMTDEEIHALCVHPQISAALLLSHGEGFGLPLFEAAYMGLPVIATGWSGQLDFLCDEKGKEHFYNVSFDLQPVPDEAVWEDVIVKDSMWAYPRETSAKAQMRQCYEDIKSQNEDSHALKACEFAKETRERFEEQKMYKAFISAMGIDEEEFNVENWLESLDIEQIE